MKLANSVNVALPVDDRAGLPQLPGHEGIGPRRTIRPNATKPGRRRHVMGVDVVLEDHRDAGQHPVPAALTAIAVVIVIPVIGLVVSACRFR